MAAKIHILCLFVISKITDNKKNEELLENLTN